MMQCGRATSCASDVEHRKQQRAWHGLTMSPLSIVVNVRRDEGPYRGRPRMSFWAPGA